MTIRRKNIFLSSSVILFFLTGALLLFESNRILLIHFLDRVFHVTLDEHFRSIGFFYTGTWLITSASILLLLIFKLNKLISHLSFFLMACSIVFIHYFYHLNLNSRNFPVFDDQGAILDFLVKFEHASTLREKLAFAFQPYNESLMVIPKLFTGLWASAFGEMNFRHLTLFNGALLLLLHFLFLGKYFSKNLVWFFILTVFVFQFQFFDDAFWAISGLCYYGAFVFAAISLSYLRGNNSAKNFLSIIYAALATFTFGNGWVLFPISILYLLKEKRNAHILLGC